MRPDLASDILASAEKVVEETAEKLVKH